MYKMLWETLWEKFSKVNSTANLHGTITRHWLFRISGSGRRSMQVVVLADLFWQIVRLFWQIVGIFWQWVYRSISMSLLTDRGTWGMSLILYMTYMRHFSDIWNTWGMSLIYDIHEACLWYMTYLSHVSDIWRTSHAASFLDAAVNHASFDTQRAVGKDPLRRSQTFKLD